MKRLPVVAAIILVVIFVGLPAQAHSDTELSAWLSDWSDRISIEVSSDLITEWRDMAERHPCRLQECPIRAVSTVAEPFFPVPPTPDAYGTFPPLVERWRAMVAIWFLPEYVDAALSVMDCESNGDPLAANPRSSARGLYQFLSSTWTRASAGAGISGASVFDPESNIRAAAWLTGGGVNWGEWSCKP